ncbi:hypothetical protein ACP70R_034521 [Stipagrostis hirtigluma subsp. patula]
MTEGRTSPAPASLPDDEDLLREILLRLPPLPSSLPRASLVSKLWRRVVSDPHFLRRFRGHHKTPPLLGFFFMDKAYVPAFTPTLPTPDRIPAGRFSFPPRRPGDCLHFFECRHGLVLLIDNRLLKAVVWDPINGRRCTIAFPPEMKMNDRHPHIKFDMYTGAVLRDCRMSAFKLVLVLSNTLFELAWVCVYDSESRKWGDIISTVIPDSTSLAQPSVLVGSALCWVLDLSGGGILQFDVDRQSLTVTQMPEDIHVTDDSHVQVSRTDDGGLGLVILSERRIQIWGSKAISDGAVRWALKKTIELDKLLSLTPSMETRPPVMLGVDEDSSVIFLWTTVGVFMIHVESVQFTKLPEDSCIRGYFPYKSFYSAGLGIDGGDDRAESFDNA